jgi:hypothetical protein
MAMTPTNSTSVTARKGANKAITIYLAAAGVAGLAVLCLVRPRLATAFKPFGVLVAG